MPHTALNIFLKPPIALCALGGQLLMTEGTVVAQASADNLALYAAVGAELTHCDLAVARATLTSRDYIVAPGVVQYAWPLPSGHVIYVISSGGQGANAVHGLSAYKLESRSAALRLNGQAVPLKYPC